MPTTMFLDRTLAEKAAFDMQCPRDQLRYLDLGGASVGPRYSSVQGPRVTVDNQSYMLDRDLGRQQGVTGCGRRTSYSYVRGVWVGNAATSEAAPPAE